MVRLLADVLGAESLPMYRDLLIETGAVGLSKISSRLGDNGIGRNNLYNLERS